MCVCFCCILSLIFPYSFFFFFFFNDTATTEIYTLSLHDALPICALAGLAATPLQAQEPQRGGTLIVGSTQVPRHLNGAVQSGDRKSTRLNSSHLVISYAVFCLKKKKKQN